MGKLRVHLFQHVPFEGLGYIEKWIETKNHTLTKTRFFENEPLPPLDEIDWLIVMGGPMGVYDEDKFLWLREEKAFIKSTIQSGKKVLGICLGAQLIAETLGAKVFANNKKEIGWFPVSLSDEAKKIDLFSDFPESFEVLHWHGDTFDLPKGAIHLIKSEACLNQAFLYNKNVLGLQFHLESIPETLHAMIENCGDELIPDEFVQTEQEIVDKSSLCTKTNEYLETILNRFSLT